MQGPLFFRPPRNAARVFALTLCLALLAGACAHDPGSQHADSRPAAPAVQSAPAADDAAQPALTLSQARQAALSDAGVTAEEVTFSRPSWRWKAASPSTTSPFSATGSRIPTKSTGATAPCSTTDRARAPITAHFITEKPAYKRRFFLYSSRP